MAEIIGGAVYTLDLDNVRFTSKLQQSETQFYAAQGRMTRATAAQTEEERLGRLERFKNSEVYKRYVGITTEAATATTKLSAAQRIANAAYRTSASQLAQQIPFAQGLSSAFGAAAVATGPLAAGVL